MILDVKNLTCIRGGRAVFEGVTFNLSAGDSLSLTGPNGSGKSTLIRCVAGLLPPAAGDVSCDGTIAYLGQTDPVKPVLTVEENVAFWAKLSGAGAGVEAALEIMGLEPLKDMPARFLSAGQKRRVGLARVLAIPADLWLLDEPMTGLDAAAQDIFAGQIDLHLKKGGAALVATHDKVKKDSLCLAA